jgi:hypothetical protein
MPTDIRFRPASKSFDWRELMPVVLFSGGGLLASLLAILSWDGF